MTVKVYLRDLRHEDDIEQCTVEYGWDESWEDAWHVIESITGEDGRHIIYDDLSESNQDKINWAMSHPSERQ